MLHPYDRVPLPLCAMLERLNLPASHDSASELVASASAVRVIQDFRPLSRNLEWQLADLHWRREGVLPFIDSNVPYLVNNNGRLSCDAAALFFAYCAEAAPAGPIHVLELGAGTGLFARYFLDEFRALCRSRQSDFYDRLSYWITDRSPRTIEQWQEREIFRDHAGHVRMAVLDANVIDASGRFHAVFLNYVLDVLPTAFLRKTNSGWQQLYVRTLLANDARLLGHYTALSFEQIRAMAATPERLEELLPLLPLLECDAQFLSVSEAEIPGLHFLADVMPDSTICHNYGALACLESLQKLLEPSGFMLVNDYSSALSDGSCTPGQRFGPCTAAGLDFERLDGHLRRFGFDVCMPEGDGTHPTRARLVVRGELAESRRVFLQRFAASVLQQGDAARQTARVAIQAGRLQEAVDLYRAAIDHTPRDWHLLWEAADFVLVQLRDFEVAAGLARKALELNPWYAPGVWNVMGDALAGLGRAQDAHECYMQADRIHPDDAETSLKLAASWLTQGNPRRSLEAIARGLANDTNTMFRHLLFKKQEEAIAALAVRSNAERAAALRRSAAYSRSS